MGRRIRIVVGEGRTAQQGLLRFVLEGEGFDIVGEATSAAELAVAIAEGQPDVVVLDDGIGVMAVSMVREVLPQTKIVLVWPSAVVPIGGDARVEPAKILNDLGPAVRHVSPVGVGAGLTETFDRPEWIERVQKDPATLRDKLDTSDKETPKRPSVTQLQRRGARLHPSSRKAKKTEPKEPAEEPAAVVALPVDAERADGGEAVSGEPAEGVDASAEPTEERSEWNRRLGTLALSGAAAVSALVLALALGGGRVDTSIVRGGGYVPPGTVFSSGGTEVGPFIGGSLGGDGYSPIPTPAPEPTNGGPGVETPAPPASGGEVAAPTGGTDQTGPDTAPGGGGGAPRAGQNAGGGGGNGGGGAKDIAKPDQIKGNPFGGPPAKLGLTPAHGAGLGVSLNEAAQHGARAASKHAHKH